MISDRAFHDARRMQLLAGVAGAVAWSPDVRVAAQRVAELLVPRLADWCTVDVLEGETLYRRLAVVHGDPQRQPRTAALLGPWTPDPRRRGVARVVRTGERQMAAAPVDAAALVPSHDGERERLVRELGLTAYVSVPLVAHSRPLGALTLVAAEPERRFGDDDVALVETLARVMGLAVANARLDTELVDTYRRQDDLLVALSHQLRTPLTAMMAWLRLVRHSPDAVESVRALDTIERNGRVLGRLVDDLMDTASILIGKVSLARRPVDLVTIVEQAVAGHAEPARVKGVRLDTELDLACRHYLGDRERLEQVVSALVANAVRFTPAGGRIVAGLDGDVTHARIRVRDSGRGITPELLPHVFDLFRRGVEGPDGQGLGLGLAIVRGLVTLHGGLVEAASEGIDRGATFTITLPHAVNVSSEGQPAV